MWQKGVIDAFKDWCWISWNHYVESWNSMDIYALRSLLFRLRALYFYLVLFLMLSLKSIWILMMPRDVFHFRVKKSCFECGSQEWGLWQMQRVDICLSEITFLEMTQTNKILHPTVGKELWRVLESQSFNLTFVTTFVRDPNLSVLGCLTGKRDKMSRTVSAESACFPKHWESRACSGQSCNSFNNAVSITLVAQIA